MSAERKVDNSVKIAEGATEIAGAAAIGFFMRYVLLMGAGAISFNPILFGACIAVASVACVGLAVDGVRRIAKGVMSSQQAAAH